MIGIDPAFRQNGYAACIIDEAATVSFRMFFSFLDVLDWVEELKTLDAKPFFCIENSNMQDASFDLTGSRAEVAKKARNVGKNQAASQYTVDLMCKNFGEDKVYEISPAQKGEKIAFDNRIFAIGKTYGHVFLKKKLNQDERDAYKMAYLGIDNFKKHKKI